MSSYPSTDCDNGKCNPTAYPVVAVKFKKVESKK